MEELLEAQGELSAFRTYQKQPAHRQRAIEAQLSGFLWNRKLEYGALIVNTLDLDRIPRPLERVLAHARSPQDRRQLLGAQLRGLQEASLDPGTASALAFAASSSARAAMNPMPRRRAISTRMPMPTRT
jgi:hypothetical protein